MTRTATTEEMARRIAALGSDLRGALFGRATVGDLDEPIEQALRARVPEHTLRALDGYIQEHRPIGHFLTAVLSNDLRDAVGYADPDNEAALCDIVRYLHNCAPSICLGSLDSVAAWIAYGYAVRQVELAARS